MGGGRFDSNTWSDYATASGYERKTDDQVFGQRGLAPELDPRGVQMRESRDSIDNPASTPLIVALDVTGSMGKVLGAMARQGLNRLMTEVYDRKPIHDPHVLAMGIGDAEAGDKAPLQITQFEADLRIAQQLEKIWLEKGGGGNHFESYALAWYFAAYHTAIDSFELRATKGYLFTVGDEEPTPSLRAQDIERVFGYRPSPERDLSATGLLAAASQKWEVYHVIVAEGAEAKANPDRVHGLWAELLGQRALWLEQHGKLAEVIVSALQAAQGVDYETIAASWDAATAAVVQASRRGISFGSISA